MKKLQKKLKKTVLWLLAAVVAFGVFCSVVVDIFGLVPGKGKTVLVAVQHGDTAIQIAETLKNDGIIHHPLLFRLYVRIKGGDYVFQRGGHELGKSMSYGKIARKLTEAPEVRYDETVKVVIPEGYEARQIAEVLEEYGLVNKESFLKELEKGDFDFEFLKNLERNENRLEGYLFPATYEFSVYENERDIIKKMLDAFEIYILPLYNQAQTEFSLDEVVTFASLVEREAANDSERQIVASVFYNRMNADMTLSSCATVQYIIKERKPILSNLDIRIKSPYNTYINKGLPIGPIASPGANSVKAVLNPAKTDYFYFAARADGSENVFARTGEEHLRNVNMLQSK